jgi:hypothetical protein
VRSGSAIPRRLLKNRNLVPRHRFLKSQVLQFPPHAAARGPRPDKGKAPPKRGLSGGLRNPPGTGPHGYLEAQAGNSTSPNYRREPIRFAR